ncbi:MAG: class II aldolase/adducin family protein [Desulfurococcales archaeon]|nr:class II aldolase/adducin family protein [Desulfurococcales archaeon]
MSGNLSSSEELLKKEICEAMRNLFLKKLVSGLGGNVSARAGDEGEFWITPSGVFKGSLRPEDLVKINLEGKVLEGRFKPSSEWRAHAAIYRVRPDVKAIAHSHNPVTVGLVSAGHSLEPVSVEAVAIVGKVETVPYAPAGSEKLAELVGEQAKTGVKALILENHGVIAMGATPYEAESIAEAIEEIAIIQFTSLALGVKPTPITKL